MQTVRLKGGHYANALVVSGFSRTAHFDSKTPLAVFFRTWSHGKHCPFIAM